VPDAIVVGAGHNGLVAAAILARAGLSVTIVEAADVVGGACRTEFPFAKAPGLGASTGAYLLGLMPPELLEELDVVIPRMRRDPHYFMPTHDGRALLLGADQARNDEALRRFSGAADAERMQRLGQELAALRDDLAPAWLQPPLSLEDTAERFIRAELRERFVALVRGSVAEHLDGYGFDDPLLSAMLAVTDAFPGIHGGLDTPGTGHNFLVHNMGRLPGANGTWTVVPGGMGTVTRVLAEAAARAGATVIVGAPVTSLLTAAGQVNGVVLEDGREVTARTVLLAMDPFRVRDLLDDAIDADLSARIDNYEKRPGTTLKVNLALRGLPRFSALPDNHGQHGATIHLLHEQTDPLGALRGAWKSVAAGELADAPPIEIYTHTTVDDTMRDGTGTHSAALFVQWVPAVTSPTKGHVPDEYVDHLLDLVDVFAPGASDLVLDRQVLDPAGIQAHFGITGGNIFHVDNTFAFDERLPYRLPIEGLFACGAGCHPAGSVIGAAGYNAARLVLS
jgi:phytoene dehydrogenase-like protein